MIYDPAELLATYLPDISRQRTTVIFAKLIKKRCKAKFRQEIQGDR